MRKLLCLGACGLLVLLAVSCSSGGGSDSGLEGTWVLSSYGTTETLSITASNFTVTDTGTYTGTMTCSITNNDTKAGHLTMTQTAASGLYNYYPNGTTWYGAYIVKGDSLLFDIDNSGFPSATIPYSRK